MSDNIIDFIQAAVEERPTSAFSAFEAEMKNAIEGLIADKSNEIGSQLFSSGGSDE